MCVPVSTVRCSGVGVDSSLCLLAAAGVPAGVTAPPEPGPAAIAAFICVFNTGSAKAE
jgi:hypothetical protein